MDVCVLKNRGTTLARIPNFICDCSYNNVNLWGRLYQEVKDVTTIHHYAASDRISYSEAVSGHFAPTSIDTSFGPIWSTHWFKLDISISETWIGKEVVLRWDSGSEAMVWKDGIPLQGLTPDHRTDFLLSRNLTGEELSHTIYIEMACSELFGAPGKCMIGPPDINKKYTLSKCHIAIYDRDVSNLLTDLTILHDMAKHLPEDSNLGYQALHTANTILNTCDVTDKQSIIGCHDVASKFLSKKNGEGQHVVHTMGHCHIDTAWLWPYAETIRKCGRSWLSTVKLMDEYPEWKFTCSQAQQYEWVKEKYPTLYDRMKHYVKAGRFIPVGGTWVEMDGLIPSGESMIRQFLFGQQFFKKEFGVKCQEFWLPDTFGYSAQLPQIMKICGITRFLTQKMSWNLVNKFPHHTFYWQGLDGSQVLAHFPPGDSYTMTGKVEELLKTMNNFKDKGRSNSSVFLFGYGDGGQGPTEAMLDFFSRIKDTDGLPKIKFSSPSEFFSHVEQESDNLCKWVGELYLELHNGTYTTHAKTKLMNRKCELLLRNVEFFSTLSWIQKQHLYPTDELATLWKLLLLNQFHDVLPGSCIEQVYKDARKYYKDIEAGGKRLLKASLMSLFGREDGESHAVINTLSWTRKAIVTLPMKTTANSSHVKESNSQIDIDGQNLVCVEVPSMAVVLAEPSTDQLKPVIIAKNQEDGLIYMKNEYLEATVDSLGRITGLALMGDNIQMRNLICDKYPANQFVIYDDVPLFWDAWDVMDYHLETRKPIVEGIQYSVITEEGPLRASVKVSLKISDASYLKQTISLESGCPYLKFTTEVEWHEAHKFLKVEFPLSIQTTRASYEIQYGFVQRPTHMNTSWDSAKFEVCGHKWADMSEYNCGVSVLNDSKYGWSARDNILRLSLLRAPKRPDPKADMMTHQFVYAMMPHAGTFQEAGVIQAAHELNVPVLVHPIDLSSITYSGSYFSVDEPAVILDTVKKCEYRDDAVILRLYEAFGGTTTACVQSSLDIKKVKMCNALEEIEDDVTVPFEDDVITLDFTPFKVITLMLVM